MLEQNESFELAWEDCGPRKPGLTRVSDVTARQVSWLSYPFIPLGKISMIEGDPGLGKSQVSLSLATAVSTGSESAFPGLRLPEPSNVLIFCNEDGLEDTIKPRLVALKADQSRIHVFDASMQMEGGIETETEIGTYVNEVKPKLIIIDPITAYFSSKVDFNRANQVRKVLHKLSELAQKNDLAVVLIRHLSKGAKVKAVYQGLGSIDFTAACRSVMLVGADPEDRTNRAMVHIKCNLAPLADSQGFRVDDGFLAWTGPSSLSAARIAGTDLRESSQLDQAKDWLNEFLSEGPKLHSDIRSAANDAGISYRTLERAKKALSVQSERLTKGSYWSLPTLRFDQDRQT